MIRQNTRQRAARTISACAAAIASLVATTVTLPNRIRVFIVYGTAIATEKGNILFFDDIYRHDERLQKALEARRVRNP